MRHKIHTVLSPAFLVLFVFIEYILRGRIESTGPYTSYGIEFVLILIVALGWQSFRYLRQKPNLNAAIAIFGTFVAGLIVRAAGKPLGADAPFDFSSIETLAFLVVIGPLLEEFLFRGVLIRLLRDVVLSRYLIILVSALAFSYSHFQVIFETPEALHGFIYYQTGYTFLLGLACGFFATEYGLLWAILAHFLFNLAFLLAGFQF